MFRSLRPLRLAVLVGLTVTAGAVAAATLPANAATLATVAPTTPTTPATECVPPNGSVQTIGGTWIVFAVPGSSCRPQAIFSVALYLSRNDAEQRVNRVASGTGDRVSGRVVVTGLTPLTSYWYHFDGAVVAGPVTTSNSTVSVTAPVTTRPTSCTATYRVVTSWPGGFLGEVVVRNAAPTTITRWSAFWTYAGTERVEHLWSAAWTPTGAAVTADSYPWNATVAPSGEVVFGFVGSAPDGVGPTPHVTCQPF